MSLATLKGKKINIYTDSKYAFIVVYVHRAIWKERRLLKRNKEIKYVQEILAPIQAVAVPKQVSIMHCLGHEKVDTYIAHGNQVAEKAANELPSVNGFWGPLYPN